MAAKDAKDFRWENLFGHNETKKVFPDFLLSLLVIFLGLCGVSWLQYFLNTL
jgi:hypothetical protein